MTLKELKELIAIVTEEPRLRSIKFEGVEILLSTPSDKTTDADASASVDTQIADPTTINWDKLTLYDSPDAWPGGSKPRLHRKPPTDPDLK